MVQQTTVVVSVIIFHAHQIIAVLRGNHTQRDACSHTQRTVIFANNNDDDLGTHIALVTVVYINIMQLKLIPIIGIGT